MRVRTTAVFVAAMLLLPSGLDAVCFAAETSFSPPVDGPVVRKFEEPLGPYAAGHRGIDYGVPSGTEVYASGSGVVKFAGPVAGDGLFITIAHDAQLETTYSFLSGLQVTAGQRVGRGDPIGFSGEGHPGEDRPVLHFGAKLAGRYLDPELLLFANLKDISDLISLAPMDEPGGAPAAWGKSGDGSSMLEPSEPIRVQPLDQGMFTTIGRKIGGLGSAIARAPRAAGDWLGRRASDVGRLVTGLKEIGAKTADAMGAAASRTKNFFGSLQDSADGFLSAVGRVIDRTGDVIKRAGSWIARAGSWIARAGSWIADKAGAVRDFFLKTVSVVKRTADSVIGRVKKLGSFVLKRGELILDTGTFVFHVGKGAIQQVACSLKGGAPPPAIPTSDEIKAGAKTPPAPNDNIVVTIAGIGSTTALTAKGTMTTNATMYKADLTTLGFSEDRVYHFSYAGIEEGGPGSYRLHKPYSKEETYKSIRDSADLLAKQIEEIGRRHPGRKIDLVAHSQGGLVAQYYLANLYDPDRTTSTPVDHFISMGSPHLGADSAQLHDTLAGTPQGDFILEGWEIAAQELGLPPPSSPSAREMAEKSAFIQSLNEGWDPRVAKTATIAATFDFVVTSPHTRLAGAEHYTADLPNAFSSLLAHGSVVDADSTKEIVYNWLADTPSTCTALRNAVADHGAGRILSEIQDTFFEAYGFVVNGFR